MANTYRKYSASVTNLLTTELNSLANAGSAVSTSEYDNTTNRYIDGEIEVNLAAAAANAGYVSVYLIEGNTTGNLATYAVLQNARKIGDVKLNGTTAVRKRLQVPGIAPFSKAVVYNGSGGALAASGNTVTMLGINYTDT